MQHKHEPRDEFVGELERHLSREVRLRNRSAEPHGWRAWPMKSAFAAVGLMLVSMSLGAAALAAAYQVQDNDRRDVLVSSYQRRADLARQRVKIAADQLQSVERRVSVGMANRDEVLEGQMRVAEADAQLKSIELQIEEIRATSREPMMELSSRASGRDFITERLRIEMLVPEAALDLERSRVREIERRAEVGTADPNDVAAARGRVFALEAAVQGYRRKLDIRQKFVKGEIDAVETELRVQESDAEQRRRTLAPQIDAARKAAENAARRFDVGVAPQIDVARARLYVQELETELAKAELDLALVRRQLDQRRAK
jgi:Outer membrane efflux protein